MSKINDATMEQWDSAAHTAMYNGRPIKSLTGKQTELTFGEHVEAKALQTQVGGSHYKNMAIQPAVFNHKNGIGFLLGTAISYLAREGQKDLPLSDVKKAIHTLQLYVQMEEEENGSN